MFHRPVHNKQPIAYFCGHSLGLQPIATKEYVEFELTKWANQAVDGHFDEPNPWLHYHTFLKPGLSHLCGALESEVVPYGSLTSNLHFLFASFYQPTSSRHKIISEDTNFPSDRFALETHVRFKGFDEKEAVQWLPHDQTFCHSTEQLLNTIEAQKDQISMIWLSAVNFLSGQVWDIPAIASIAHKYGILVGLDLAHAIGNVPLRLHDWNVDFAVWCSYKYLNGGPGAVGGYFVHEKHFPSTADSKSILAGWWGNDANTRFDVGKSFVPTPNADAWQHSNANVLSLAAIRASLDLFSTNNLDSLHQKSLVQTELAYDLLRNLSTVRLLTPKESRGNMISIQIKDPDQDILTRLKELNQLVDWREPGIMRFSFCPLYNTKQEWEQFLLHLTNLL